MLRKAQENSVDIAIFQARFLERLVQGRGRCAARRASCDLHAFEVFERFIAAAVDEILSY